MKTMFSDWFSALSQIVDAHSVVLFWVLLYHWLKSPKIKKKTKPHPFDFKLNFFWTSQNLPFS